MYFKYRNLCLNAGIDIRAVQRQFRDMLSSAEVSNVSTGWLFQPTRPHVLELTVADRTDGPDVRLPSFSGCPRLSRYSLSCLSLHRTTKEETSCGSGSIFRVRRCNKKQSSQRGVDIADGTDGHVAFVESTIASQPYCTTPRPFLYLFLRRLRFRFIVTTRPNGICISKFVNC